MDAKAVAAQVRSGRAVRTPLSPTLVIDLVRALDVAVILAVGFVVYQAYVYPGEPETQNRYLVSLLLAALLAGLLFQWCGVYRGDLLLARRLRAERILYAWSVTFGLLLAIAFALKISDHYSRVWAGTWFTASAGVFLVARLVLSRWLSRWAQSGRFASRAIIVGTGEAARRLAAHLGAHDKVRTRILGLAEDSPEARGPGAPDVVGGLDDVVRLIRAGQVDEVFVALPWQEAGRVREAVERLALTPVAIRLAPDLAGFEFPGRPVAAVAGLPVLHLFERPISGWSRLSKAIEDRVLAALIVLTLAPLLLLIALAIKLDSPGPVLFRQPRYGFNGNLIEVFKFRTMRHDQRDERAETLTTRDDSRVTRLGRLLRRLSLDELPQLFNVLRGEMSLVGPRPHAVAAKAAGCLYHEAVDRYAARHRVKPGITGWAQVNGWRGETDTLEKIRKRVEYDQYYIENWSLWLDLLIIARTVLIVLADRKAY